jgi:hypothetical protein
MCTPVRFIKLMKKPATGFLRAGFPRFARRGKQFLSRQQIAENAMQLIRRIETFLTDCPA